jgi:hypothetical protein
LLAGSTEFARIAAHVQASLMLAALSTLALPNVANAAHPLISEDTWTQGAGNVELEIGASKTIDARVRAYQVQPQLSLGAAPAIDVIVRPTWLNVRGGDAASGQSFGNTAVDFKWRFYADDPLSFGVRAGVDAPTGDGDLGFSTGKPSYHGTLILTANPRPFTINANVGYVHNLSVASLRSDLAHVSTSAAWNATAELVLLTDVAADSNPDGSRATWPAVILGGFIYNFSPNFSVDFGYQARLNHAAPSQQWLAGVTYRWGLWRPARQ